MQDSGAMTSDEFRLACRTLYDRARSSQSQQPDTVEPESSASTSTSTSTSKSTWKPAFEMRLSIVTSGQAEHECYLRIEKKPRATTVVPSASESGASPAPADKENASCGGHQDDGIESTRNTEEEVEEEEEDILDGSDDDRVECHSRNYNIRTTDRLALRVEQGSGCSTDQSAEAEKGGGGRRGRRGRGYEQASSNPSPPAQRGPDPPLPSPRSALAVCYDILLHPTYRVPVLYFRVLRGEAGGVSSQAILDVDSVEELLVPRDTRKQLRSVGVLGGLSIANHPIDDVPAFFVHPCNTPRAMMALVGERKDRVSPVEYLQIWLGLVGGCVGLHLPKELAVVDTREEKEKEEDEQEDLPLR